MFVSPWLSFSVIRTGSDAFSPASRETTCGIGTGGLMGAVVRLEMVGA
jgi:hypothetical protein